MNDRRSAVGSWRARVLFSALPLVVSCADGSATGPSNDGVRSVDVHALEARVFVVEPTVFDVPTYDGSGQAVHPDVVRFDHPWNGSRFWMTMTPYPRSDQTLENPSILTSDDGRTVAMPLGLQNPVIKPPRRAKDYNSDPELLYEPQTDRLVLFYRLVDKNANTVHVSTSRDGLTWKANRAPFWERSHRVVSPTVAPRTGGAARMWYVNAGKAGCDAKSTSVLTRVAADTTGRFADSRWIGPERTDLSIPGYEIWHIKARWVPEKSEYWMLISAYPDRGNGCQTDDLFLARSSDGLHWTVYPEPILRHEDREWTAAAIYRSSFVYDAKTDELSLWISARGTDGAWRMGYARARYTSLLAALLSRQPVTAHPANLFSAPALPAGQQP